MNDEKQAEAMARLDGYYWEDLIGAWKHDDYHNEVFYTDGDIHYRQIPAYLTSHDAVQRVWLTLTANEKRLAIAHLTGLGGILESGGLGRFLLDMSASEWCEAILKAVGKWEDQESE